MRHARWIALVLISANLPAFAADSWRDMPPIPTARQEVGVTALGRHVYVIAGIDANRDPSGVVERFDVDRAEWEEVAPLPEQTRVHHVGAASIDGKVFTLGGLNRSFRGVRDVFAYDPVIGRWESRAPLPWPRGSMAVGVVEGRVVVAGGQDGSSSKSEAAWYDPASDLWEELPALRTERNHLAGVTLDGKFYAISGRASGLRGEVEVFDPATRSWNDVASLLTPRAGIAAAAVEGRIFVFGGEGNSFRRDGIFSEVESFDPKTGRWSARPPMPRPRHGIGVAVVDGRVYVPGGGPVEGFGVTDVHDMFIPCPSPAVFLRGDANGDTSIDVSDGVQILLYLFGRGEISCLDAADSDDSGDLSITDAIFLLNFLFLGGAVPPEPGTSSPGSDPTEDGLSCR